MCTRLRSIGPAIPQRTGTRFTGGMAFAALWMFGSTTFGNAFAGPTAHAQSALEWTDAMLLRLERAL